MTDIKKIKKCRDCKYFNRRTKEELCLCRSFEEVKSFDGSCHRYPESVEVGYNWFCGEWVDKKIDCLFRDKNGECTNSYFIEGKLCDDVQDYCDIEVYKYRG